MFYHVMIPVNGYGSKNGIRVLYRRLPGSSFVTAGVIDHLVRQTNEAVGVGNCEVTNTTEGNSTGSENNGAAGVWNDNGGGSEHGRGNEHWKWKQWGDRCPKYEKRESP